MLKLNRGSIITISSVLSSIAPAQLSDYAASKAALKSLHSSLTAELSTHPGIKTLLVTPGQLSTPLFYGVKTPSNFLVPVLESVDVAKEIIAAIDGGLGGHIAMPVYAQWIAVMEVLPASARRLLRWASGADRAMAGFKGRKVLDQEGSKVW
jgi:short-subunit dehydrogenase